MSQNDLVLSHSGPRERSQLGRAVAALPLVKAARGGRGHEQRRGQSGLRFRPSRRTNTRPLSAFVIVIVIILERERERERGGREGERDREREAVI